MHIKYILIHLSFKYILSVYVSFQTWTHWKVQTFLAVKLCNTWYRSLIKQAVFIFILLNIIKLQ